MADSRLRGYEYDFVESVKDLHKCPICFLPMREPEHIAKCGHVFCKSCLDSWISASPASVAKCPVDNETPIQGNTFFDRRLDREIKSLKVYCENHASGCTRQLELGKYNEHLLHCPQRQVSCVFCHQPVMFIKSQEHTIECAFYKTDCLFAPIGCSEKIERRFLNSHHRESTQKHLNMLTLAALRQYTKGDFVSEKEADVTHELPASLLAKFAEIKDKSVAVPSSVGKPSDPVSNKSLENSIKPLKQSIESLKSDNKKLRKEVRVVTEDNKALKAKITDLTERVEELTQDIDEIYDAEDAKSITSGVPTSENYVYASPLADSLFCPYTWHVDLAKCMGAHMSFSPSFYSCKGGYKLHLTINYDGLKDGNHWWLFQCFLMKGDYDSSLSWPFKGILHFTVERVDTMKVLSKNKCNYNSNKGRTIKQLHTPIFYYHVGVSLENMTTKLVVGATVKLS